VIFFPRADSLLRFAPLGWIKVVLCLAVGMAVSPTKSVANSISSDAKALYGLGSMHFAEGRLDEAIKEFTQAAQLWPESVLIRHRLAAACLVKAHIARDAKDKLPLAELAWSALKEVEERLGPSYEEGGLYEVCLGLGDLCAEVKWWREAEDCFEWAWSIQQGRLEPLLKKGAIQASRDAWKDAEETFDRVLREDSDNKDALYHKAHGLWQREKPRRAIRLLDDLVETEEPDARVLFLYGLILEDRGHPDKAREKYERLLEEKDDHRQALKRLAFLFQREENWSEASIRFRRLLELDEDDPGARFGLATCLERLGLFRASVHQFRALIQEYPGGPEVLNYLGYMYAENGLFLDQAEALIRNALRSDPRNGAYMDSLGWVYYQKRQYDRALDSLKEAQALLETAGEDDPVVREHLGDTYAHLDMKEEALDQWKAALRIDPKNSRVRSKVRTGGLFPPF